MTRGNNIDGVHRTRGRAPARPLPRLVRPALTSPTVTTFQAPRAQNPSAPSTPQSHSQSFAGIPKVGSKKRFTQRFNLKSVASLGCACAILAFSVWLGFDVWQTNRAVEETFSSDTGQQAAVAGSSTGPAFDESQPKGDPLAGYTVAPNLPRAIHIEKLRIKSRIIRTGVTRDNAMEVPKSIFDVGWYDGAARPGENGAVVLSGHVSGPTKDGVFKRLKQLVAGDVITIERGDGTMLRYRVASLQTVKANAVDMAKLITAVPGTEALHLITCGGRFDERSQQFEDRTIVYASRI